MRSCLLYWMPHTLAIEEKSRELKKNRNWYGSINICYLPYYQVHFIVIRLYKGFSIIVIIIFQLKIFAYL